MSDIRLYSKKHRGSFDIVELGLSRALQHSERLAGVVDLEKDAPEPGITAKYAIVVSNPFLAQLAHLRGVHDETWLVLAPNSEGIPPSAKELLMQDIYSVAKNQFSQIVDGIFSPSTWGLRVLEREFPGRKVALLRHGVQKEFSCDVGQREKVRKAFDEGRFVVLHSSSTFTDRKGTRELLEAWSGFSKRIPKAELHIACQPGLWMQFQELAARFGAGGVHFQRFFTSTLAGWARILGGIHVLVQPSRAEGFGLIPLEARAVGTPIVATSCTGHSEHVSDVPGVEVVPSHGMADVDDYGGAQAPIVLAEDIGRCLERMFDRYVEHHEAALEAAPRIGCEWAWEKVVNEDLAKAGW